MKRKSLLFVLVPILSLSIIGCTGNPTPIASAENQAINEAGGKYLLDFYSINDFHGAITEDTSKMDGSTPIPEPGIEKIGAFIRKKRNENLGGSVFLANGDMFQGTADSNITRGKMVMEMMNYLDFTSASLGNHEFDWTLDTLKESMEEAEAIFPVLACNVVRKDSLEQEVKTYITDDYSFIKPYTTITRGVGEDKIKIGIIGSIAMGLEKSILPSLVADYHFEEPLEHVKKYSEQLRTTEGCDVIVYTTHGDANTDSSYDKLPGYINEELPNYVDAIFTGHAHREFNKTMTRTDGSGVQVPVMQGISNGVQMSYVQLSVDKVTKAVKAEKQETLDYDDFKAYGNDSSMRAIYKRYYKDQIKAIKEEKLGKIDAAKSKSEIAQLVVNETLKWANTKEDNVMAAVINGEGGIRTTWEKGTITYGDVYKTLPFDNANHFLTIRKSQYDGITGGIQGGTFHAESDGFNDISGSSFIRVCLLSFVAEQVSVGTEEVIYDTFPRDIVADAFRNHPQHNPFK